MLGDPLEVQAGTVGHADCDVGAGDECEQFLAGLQRVLGIDVHEERDAGVVRLERAGTQDPIDIIVEANAAKVEAIAKAQADGTLTDRWSAVDLLGLVLQISGLWSGMTPEYAALVAEENHAHRRAVIVDAVRALLA